MQQYQPKQIFIERGEENAAVVLRTLERLPHVPVRIVDKDWERDAPLDQTSDTFAT